MGDQEGDDHPDHGMTPSAHEGDGERDQQGQGKGGTRKMSSWTAYSNHGSIPKEFTRLSRIWVVKYVTGVRTQSP